MEHYQRPEPPKLPKFEDEWEVVPDTGEDTEERGDEGIDETYDTHTTVAFACLSCGYTKFIHYWRSDPDGLDKARYEYT